MRRKKYVIIGIDEAGRGPLAGPLAVAAVAATVNQKFRIRNLNLETRFLIGNRVSKLFGIKDSKKLSARQREEWARILRENFECAAAFVGPRVIDKIGIQKATRVAVARVLRKFLPRNTISGQMRQNTLILLDGSMSAPKHYNQKTIIKGDEKIPLIAAASIIAKTSRDAKILRLHKKFPEYCFNRHKGYGTELHYRRIKKNGLSSIHRRSFCRNIH